MTRNDFDHRHIWSGTCLQPVPSTTQFTHFFTSLQTSPSLGIRLGTIIRIIMVIIITINIIIMIRMVTTTTSPLLCPFCHWLAVVLCSTTMVTIISTRIISWFIMTKLLISMVGNIETEMGILMYVDDYYYNPKSVWRLLWTEYSSHYGPWCSRLTLFSGSRDFYSLPLYLATFFQIRHCLWMIKTFDCKQWSCLSTNLSKTLLAYLDNFWDMFLFFQ